MGLRVHGAVVLGMLAVATSCKRSSPGSGIETNESSPETESLSEDGSAPPAPEPPGPPPRCEPSGSVTSVSIRGRSAAEEGTESGVDQPFAVELGGAAVTTSGFVVGALRHDGGQTEALVTWMDSAVRRSREVSLGRVHGTPEPPKLVTVGDRVIAAVVDSDASGPTLRLARFEAGATDAGVSWGASVQQGRDDSTAFSLALHPSGERGLLAWDEYDAGRKRTVLRGLPFVVEPWGEAAKPRVLALPPAGPSEEADAEAPALVARPGGYWLAWIAHPALRRGGAEPTPDPTSAADPAEERSALVEGGPSQLRVALLDDAGALLGEPRSVTAPDAQVVAFDLLASADGRAHLAWRDDARAPGGSGGALFVASLSPDGTTQKYEVDAAALDAGLPALLQEGSLSPSGPLWLAASGAQGQSFLGQVTAATGVEEWRAEPLLGARQPLVAGHGGILFAQPRGLDVLLDKARCAPAATPQPAPPSSPSAAPSGPVPSSPAPQGAPPKKVPPAGDPGRDGED
jgi:hypothetical protein